MPPKIKFRPIVLENLPRHEIHIEYFVPSSCFDRATCGRRSEIEQIIAMFAHGPWSGANNESLGRDNVFSIPS